MPAQDTPAAPFTPASPLRRGQTPSAPGAAPSATPTPKPRQPGPLAQALLRLRARARLALTGLLLAAFTFALATHHIADPGFSTTGSGEALRNALGAPGAWVSDVALMLLGFSAWWLVLVGWVTWLRALAAHTQRALAAPGRPLRLVGGTALLLAASCALEWTRLYRFEPLLLGHSGGVLGEVLGRASQAALGFTASGVLWIALLALALPLAFGFSWLRWADALGAWVEGLRRNREQQRERAEDERIGEIARHEREADLWPPAPPADGAATPPAPPPVVIAPPPPAPAPSKRAVAESQTKLFGDTGSGKLPPLHLLDKPPARAEAVTSESLEMTSRLIEKKLFDFGVQVRVVEAQPGPVITRYEIEPAVGVKGSQIVNLAKDLARSLSLVSIRVVETIPGKNLMALELPNAKRQTIRLAEILGSKVYHDATSPLTLALGKDIVGLPVVADLARMPHCLVAGTTGAGKSVGINGMILSLLYKAEARDVRLILIDPKMLEMSVYEGIPHLLCPVVTDMKQAGNALTWCVGEMERRYKLMSKQGVRNLAGYNKKLDDAAARGESIPNPLSLTPDAPEPLERLPHIVIVIDELADLMMVVGKRVEELIARLAQKARASGIHLVLATQRPSVDVITGLIKANIPTRLSFQVSSKIDSRTILDQMGAEALLGMGDMLYLPSGTGLPIRVHGAFVADDEVHRVVEALKAQGEPNYIEGILEGGTLDGESDAGGGASTDGEADPMYDQAVAIVLQHRKASISLVQRHLRIGYNRAARLLEQMEQSGLVSAMNSNGSRDLLTPVRDE